jgi:hypothetical protein
LSPVAKPQPQRLSDFNATTQRRYDAFARQTDLSKARTLNSHAEQYETAREGCKIRMAFGTRMESLRRCVVALKIDWPTAG